MKKFIIDISEIYQLPFFKNHKQIKFNELRSSQKIGGIKINIFKVTHIAGDTPAKALAIRFTLGKKTFVYSGDSARCEGIEKACKKANLFICDASCSKNRGGTAHMDTNNIAEVCKKSLVKKVILTHIYPQYKNVDLASEVKEAFDGKIVLAKDLMQIKI